MASAAFKYGPHTAATTFAFSYVCFFFYAYQVRKNPGLYEYVLYSAVLYCVQYMYIVYGGLCHTVTA